MTKILLVEDNDVNREMLSRRLERKGFQVIVAIDGAEAVAKTQSDRPDLVLMDLHLPILNGWEATRQIKGDPQIQAIPVIALTADATIGEREKALAAGCDEYDTKPVDFSRLLEKIDQLLQPAVPQPATLNLTPDRQLQQLLLPCLRRELEPPIDRIIGLSDLLLNDSNVLSLSDSIHSSQSSELCSDLEKIHSSSLHLLTLIQTILNPVLIEIQLQDWTISRFVPVLRRELLTPLSTIMGYCELLLEEAPTELSPDLQQIHASAQSLLSLMNQLDSLMTRHLQSIRTTDIPSSPPTPKPLARSIPKHSLLLAASQILVVDPANSLLLQQLERQGCQVTIATLEQATETLATESHDLALLDISQSGAGLQLLEGAQANWRQPILIIAAADQMLLVMQAIAMGATDYLIKPISSLLLHAKVIALLQQEQL